MRLALAPLLATLVLLVAPVQEATAQEGQPVVYTTQYRIKAERLDSLMTLIERYDVPWHDFVAANVPGYKREHFVHDTGNDYNLMVVTTYPDWDMVRGDEIPFDALFPQYVASIGMTMEQAESEGVNAMFEWAYEGSEHMDQIWRPVTAEN